MKFYSDLIAKKERLSIHFFLFFLKRCTCFIFNDDVIIPREQFWIKGSRNFIIYYSLPLIIMEPKDRHAGKDNNINIFNDSNEPIYVVVSENPAWRVVDVIAGNFFIYVYIYLFIY